MTQSLRLAALATVVLGLSGCNMVVSDKLWFTAADAQPMPVFRDGLWLQAEPDCRFDEARPAERWPDCASASVVSGGQRWSMEWTDTDDRGRRRRTFAGWEPADPGSDALLIANGDHAILQFQAQGEEGAEPLGEPGAAAGDPAPPLYMYAGVRFLRRDIGGEVTMLESWPVQCGPLPQPDASRRTRRRSDADAPAQSEGDVTDRPFAGLTVGDSDCTAENADAVRNAAALSEALGARVQQRWIREGWH